jgi:FtsP/CotA-like multicopper oxidase with cupredoxin domain
MIHRTRSLGLVLALAVCIALLASGSALALPGGAPKIGMVCTPGSVSGSTHTFELMTSTGYIHTPDGNTVFMWSYAVAPPNDPLGAGGVWPDFQSPGPVLCVTQGETVVVNLTNNLPEPASITFPGQDSAVTASGGSAGLLTTEAAASGGTVSYSFTAGNPGTYLYQSGSNVSKQVEMGLYGALVVRPILGANYAYDASTQFDPSREYMLLLAEVDPALHHAVETGGAYDFTALHNRYFTINGRSFPDTIQDNGTALLPSQPYGALVRLQPTNGSSQPALIRMLNAGADNHPFHPHGNHTREIAQDGRQLLSPSTGRASTEHFGETIGSGQTIDYLIRWDNVSTDTAGQAFNDYWNPITNTLPVTQPNYLNLTFKDGNTYYSGSPYLGYKGTLPTGTVSQNICGEWYFPFHSHALNEFSNFDEGFGGMGTLLRVDPSGGCFTSAASTVIVGGALKSGSVTALKVADSTYYQVNPKTTTRPSSSGTMSTGATTTAVSSAAGFPTTNGFYVRIDNEVMQVTGGAGTTTWTVCRTATCRLGTSLASHAAGATVTALANDWYTTFSGVPTGSLNLKVTYTGKNCGNTSGSSCTAIPSNSPQQTVKICDWTIAGAAGCSSATSNGWVTVPLVGPAQPQSVGSSDVTTTWTLPGSGANYIGTGANKGQVRILVHTQRWTASNPTAFSTWGNFMQLVYDAP